MWVAVPSSVGLPLGPEAVASLVVAAWAVDPSLVDPFVAASSAAASSVVAVPFAGQLASPAGARALPGQLAFAVRLVFSLNDQTSNATSLNLRG